jgi:hypothetical protein
MMKSDKQQQDKASNSKEQPLTSKPDDLQNQSNQADGFRYDYDDSSDLK